MNPTAIFSKTGKGVQEASGKTSHLSRADRNVLKEIDGKTALADVALKFEKLSAEKFDALIQQLDKDGYIREVSSGFSEPAPPVRRTAPPPPRTPPASRAAPPPSDDGGEFLDFTQAIKLPPKGPAVDLAAASHAEAERKAKEQGAFDYKARQEAEAKARAAAEEKAREAAEAKSRAESDAKVKAAREAAMRLASEAKAKTEAAEQRARKEAEERARLEAEMKARLEEERKAREEAERRAAEAAEQARKELEEKAKREAEEMRQRLEAEMRAKLEEERGKREEEEKKRRQEEEQRRAKEEAERRAREEADKKRREEEDRKRREEDERRRKEEQERRARGDEERKRRAKEDEERRAKEDEERRARDEQDRKRRDEDDRKRREEDDRRRREETERRAREEAEAKASAAEAAARSSSQPAIPASAPPAVADPLAGLGDSLLADLDSFSQRDEEERKAKEEAERKEKEAAARRAREEEERRKREEEDRRRREEEERKAKAEAERRAREEEERREREEEEEEERKQAEEERKRKAKEAAAANEAEEKAARSATSARSAAKGDDDVGVTDEDLDMDDVKRDEKALSKEARRREAERMEPAVAAKVRRPVNWGKPAAVALFVILIGGVGALNVMPVSTAEYEKAASEALGVPVKIASARLSVLTSVEVRLEGVSVGDEVKIRLVRGFPEIGSLFGAKKAFGRIELEGASLSQGQLGAAMFDKLSGDNFRVQRILIKQAKLEGPLALPALDVEATIAGDGAVRSLSLAGPDKLAVRLAPKGSEAEFEISAASLALPFVPALSLSDFGMKGTATRQGVSASEFDGRAFDGVISGKARIGWGASWSAEGELRARGVKVAVFAPTLVSEGKVEANGKFSMSGPVPAKLYEGARLDGTFKIDNGVIGNFDLTRALQTGGTQTGGRTVFAELTGQGVYDKGNVQLRNIAITAGAMSAGVSLDIDAGGALLGRIAADVKTPNQTLRAVLNISGKLQDPVVRK